jgi:hypothetical protein
MRVCASRQRYVTMVAQSFIQLQRVDGTLIPTHLVSFNGFIFFAGSLRRFIRNFPSVRCIRCDSVFQAQPERMRIEKEQGCIPIRVQVR